MRPTLIALHGFTMNATGLGYMMAELEPRLRDVIDITYPNAPHTASPESVVGLAAHLGVARPKPPNLQWWSASEDGTEYIGWKESRALLAAEVSRHPAVGILGFSQGAAVAAALAAASSRGEFPPLRFVVLVAGFAARAADIAPLFEQPVRVPSLHVWGERDRFGKHAPGLLERFDPATRQSVTWPGPHVVPTSGAAADAVVAFIRQHALGQ